MGACLSCLPVTIRQKAEEVHAGRTIAGHAHRGRVPAPGKGGPGAHREEARLHPTRAPTPCMPAMFVLQPLAYLTPFAFREESAELDGAFAKPTGSGLRRSKQAR